MPAHEREAAVVEPVDLAHVIELVDDLVAAAQHGRCVERAGHRLAHARHAPRLAEQLGWAQKRLDGMQA